MILSNAIELSELNVTLITHTATWANYFAQASI